MIIWENPVGFLLFFGAVVLVAVTILHLALVFWDRFGLWRERRALKRYYQRKMP